jgi:hypothetical protein
VVDKSREFNWQELSIVMLMFISWMILSVLLMHILEPICSRQVTFYL